MIPALIVRAGIARAQIAIYTELNRMVDACNAGNEREAQAALARLQAGYRVANGHARSRAGGETY